MPDRGLVLVRVAQEIVDQLATADSEPVIVVAIVRQADGTHDMVLKFVVEDVVADRARYRDALVRIQEIAAREWAADETNYEWYGDIAGMAEAALGIDIWKPDA